MQSNYRSVPVSRRALFSSIPHFCQQTGEQQGQHPHKHQKVTSGSDSKTPKTSQGLEMPLELSLQCILQRPWQTLVFFCLLNHLIHLAKTLILLQKSFVAFNCSQKYQRQTIQNRAEEVWDLSVGTYWCLKAHPIYHLRRGKKSHCYIQIPSITGQDVVLAVSAQQLSVNLKLWPIPKLRPSFPVKKTES